MDLSSSDLPTQPVIKASTPPLGVWAAKRYDEGLGQDNLVVMILGSGRGLRRVDPDQSRPYSLMEIGTERHEHETPSRDHGTAGHQPPKLTGSVGRAMDWVLEALRASGVRADGVHFVGGYHIQKVIDRYPSFRFSFDPQWHRHEAGGALAAGVAAMDRAWLKRPVLIAESTVVFRADSVAALMDAGVDVAVICSGDALPLMLLSAQAVKVLVKAVGVGRLDPMASLTDVAAWLMEQSELTGRYVQTESAALLSNPTSLAAFVMGSKAMTLAQLRPLVRKSVVLEQVCLTVAQWREDPVRWLSAVRHAFGDALVVVRSSAVHEDGWQDSCAGQFDSVLDVPAGDAGALGRGIDKVVAAYERLASDPQRIAESQVFVQPQLMSVAASGVVLTRDPATDAPYRLMTVDRSSGRTDSVTAGDAAGVENHVVYRDAPLAGAERWMRCVFDAVDEIELLVGHDRLDIEFALDAQMRVYILQVRPLTQTAVSQRVDPQDVVEQLAGIRALLKTRAQPEPGVWGDRLLLGNMPDWNPAEMIGVAPRPLALSLYQTLITDRVWAQARALMGYRDLSLYPLMVALGGQPYIDVRLSFNSLIPACLDESVGRRVVDAALGRLAERPGLHDKIEFEVLATCADADYQGFADRCAELGLTPGEADAWWRSLLSVTKGLLFDGVGAIDTSRECLNKLEVRRQEAMASLSGGTREVSIEQLARGIWCLHRACTELGTLPFAMMARHGFVAVSLLRSFVRAGAVTQAEADAFTRGLPTVASDVARGLWALHTGQMGTDAFVDQFGHLRPGTYDLLSPSYRETVDQLLAATSTQSQSNAASCRAFTGQDLVERCGPAMIQALLRAGFGEVDETGIRRVVDYIAAGIQGREWAKFEMTRTIDSMLGLVRLLADRLGISEAEATFLPVDEYLRLATDVLGPGAVPELRRRAGGAAKRLSVTRALRLPALIGGVDEVQRFCLGVSVPNYVTQERAEAETVALDTGRAPCGVQGKIVLIENADPGFDWLFAAGIAGLVTKHGGAASHMAIRAAEFGLPAAIGCGEAVYEKACRAQRLTLDGQTRTIWGQNEQGHWPVHVGDAPGGLSGCA